MRTRAGWEAAGSAAVLRASPARFAMRSPDVLRRHSGTFSRVSSIAAAELQGIAASPHRRKPQVRSWLSDPQRRPEEGAALGIVRIPCCRCRLTLIALYGGRGPPGGGCCERPPLVGTTA